jgi:O-acetyl-ADP-ribose deacetylase (regulator of RNase III)
MERKEANNLMANERDEEFNPMDVPKLEELYYITHINNLPSILKNGILSGNNVIKKGIMPVRIVDKELVEKRSFLKIPLKKGLFDYVALYFQPRNAMLYRIVRFGSYSIDDIVILELDSKKILKMQDVVITDGNPVHPLTHFLENVNEKHIKKIREQINKSWWIEEDGSKRKMMAECLVPEMVPPNYIISVYTATEKATQKIKSLYFTYKFRVICEPWLFFQHRSSENITDNLKLVKGDIFFSSMQTITITVNTIGVMGKGLADRAKRQFPDCYVVYQDLCKRKEIKLGIPVIYKREIWIDRKLAEEGENLPQEKLLRKPTWFLFFPTKDKPQNKSNKVMIEEGLKWLIKNYKQEGIDSLAIPALGCGLGGLKWEAMKSLFFTYLSKLDIPVELYVPGNEEISKGRTKAWKGKSVPRSQTAGPQQLFEQEE